MKRLCMDCSETLKGRADKKFCNDGCRSNFNNNLRAKQDKMLINKINFILRKNQQILEKLNPGRKSRISTSKILASGLNLSYFTHQYQTQKGNLYRFCYDQGYIQLNEKAFLLIKRDNY